MRRSWIGLFLLLVLLIVGLALAWAIEDVHEPITAKLESAAEEALKQNWVSAAWFTAEAHSRWESWVLFRAALADHVPSEEVEALFAALDVYGASRESVSFAALSRELAKKIEAIGKAHGLNWENLL